MTEIKLRRYTCLDELTSILQNNAILISNQDSWDDKNDVCYIEEYKRANHYKTVLVKCFSESEETFLMWKAYTDKETGVCIEFDKGKLLRQLTLHNMISGYVDYPTIRTRQTKTIQLSRLPFLKRFPYRAEKEYRIIYFFQETLSNVSIQISKSCITRVLLSPWLAKSEYKETMRVIQLVPGWDDLAIQQSSVLSTKDWLKAVNNYVP